MKKILIVSIALAVSAVATFASTITFSELGLVPGNLLSNQLASLGVVFVVNNGTATIVNSFSPPGGSTIAGQYVNVGSSGGTASVNAYFVDPSNSSIPGYVNGTTVFVDLWDTEAGSPRMTVNAYDLGNTLIGTYNLTSEWVNNANGFTGNVHRLEFVDVGSDGHVFDNLDYGAITSVPEPGTFALLGFGLVGLGLAFRRKRA